LHRAFKLPEALRKELGKPLGEVYEGEETKGEEFRKQANQPAMVITVGDRVTETFGELGRTPDVQVVDGVERRSKRDPPKVPYVRLVKVRNPAGEITSDAIRGMRSAFGGRKPVRVMVDGEEDLLAMVAVAMAPISSTVYYGQPQVGVVVVKVNAVSKSRNRAMLAKMGIERM
jgi:GTP-dependent dephospho-CoA kinase